MASLAQQHHRLRHHDRAPGARSDVLGHRHLRGRHGGRLRRAHHRHPQRDPARCRPSRRLPHLVPPDRQHHPHARGHGPLGLLPGASLRLDRADVRARAGQRHRRLRPGAAARPRRRALRGARRDALRARTRDRGRGDRVPPVPAAGLEPHQPRGRAGCRGPLRVPHPGALRPGRRHRRRLAGAPGQRATLGGRPSPGDRGRHVPRQRHRPPARVRRVARGDVPRPAPSPVRRPSGDRRGRGAVERPAVPAVPPQHQDLVAGHARAEGGALAGTGVATHGARRTGPRQRGRVTGDVRVADDDGTRPQPRPRGRAGSPTTAASPTPPPVAGRRSPSSHPRRGPR